MFARKDIDTTFELTDTLYAKANVAAVQDVYLWLGVRAAVRLHKLGG